MITIKESKTEIPTAKPKEEEESDGEPDQTTDSKPKKLPKVAINTTNTRGELKLIEYLIEKNKKYGWKRCGNMDGDVMWAGLEIPWEGVYVATEMHLNRIPGVSDLSSKKVTGYYLNKFREYYPENFDFFPRTFLIPEESEQLQAYMKANDDRYYIAKPTDGAQGDGIILMKNFKDLPSKAYGSPYSGLVVQEYVSNPLLIDGKKFDLRLYLLISNVKPMIAFLCDEGLARFSTEDYSKPTKDNFRKSFMHLTNYSLNKNSPNFVYTEECHDMNLGTKRTLESFWRSFTQAGHDKDELMNNIIELMRNLLIAIQPYLEFSYHSAFGNKTEGKCFHVLGIDVLVDDELKPWLLEINANPSMDITHELEGQKKAVISPVDRYVKAMVMEDAILISRKSANKQGEIDRYGSFVPIFHGDEIDSSGLSIFKDIISIYSKLSGAKFKNSLTSSKFAKIGNLSGLTNQTFTKVDYDILFKKMLANSDSKTLDFPTFIMAMEHLAKRLYGDSSKTSMELVVSSILSQL